MIPFVFKQLAHSEKAVAAGLFWIVLTILMFMGRISVEQWTGASEIVLGIYVAGKSLQGGLHSLGKSSGGAVSEAVPAVISDIDTQRAGNAAA